MAERDDRMGFPHLIKWVEMGVRARVERAMRDEPVSGSQLFALVLLDEREETTAADLARLMHLTPQALTTLLKPLRDHGLIAREPDEAHRRRLNMRLTEAGRSIIARARSLTPEIEEAMLGHLSPRERETLHKLLERIVRPMD